MRRVARWIAIGVAVLLGLAGASFAALYTVTESRLDREYDIQVEAVSVPADPDSVDRGRKLATTTGFCTECHGEDLSGQIMEDDPMVGTLVASNLTHGEGGIGGKFTETDWVRAIRHGIDSEGRSLLVMPSNFYHGFSDADLGAIVAYAMSVPAVDNPLPETRLGPMGRVFLLQDPTLLPAEVIDHDSPRPPEPVPGVTVEYGRYKAIVCTLCHGENLAGVEEAGGGLNLTPAGDLATWTEAEFIAAMRTGLTPEGESLDPELMPWDKIGQMTDEELKAIWLFLQSLPPVDSVAPEA